MSQKKRKKGKNQNYGGGSMGGQANPLLDERNSKNKRMCPATRNLLFGDLVLLATVQLMENMNLLSEVAVGLVTLVGLGVLLYAVWLQLQYSKNSNVSGPKGPRL